MKTGSRNNKINMNSKSGSIVEYFGNDEGHKCGYCRGLKSNLSHGMWAHTLCVEDYENLINRGWRRSGHYCYKPIMHTTCCPQYTIRCNAIEFQLNNSHKKVLKKFRNFLEKEGSFGIKKNTDVFCTPENSSKYEHGESSADKRSETMETNTSLHKSSLNKSKVCLPASSNDHDKTLECVPAQLHSTPKTIEDFILQEPINPQHRIKIKLVDLTSSEFDTSLQASHQLYVKYQMHVHHDKEEDCSLEQFKRFLVMSPLQSQSNSNFAPGIGYGSYHQQYWIDEKLVAVGVIDILPSCLSSVYFYYDPDYSYLSLGTYASLREIAFVRQLAQRDPSFGWYYLGFYIHSCPKMYYKGQYKPSYLLCPETYTFHPFASSISKLDCNKYSRLLQDSYPEDENELQLAEVGILFKRRAITYNDYTSIIKRLPKDESKKIEEYVSLVGEKTANKMLLYRS